LHSKSCSRAFGDIKYGGKFKLDSVPSAMT
jgi:hypothetical protein